MSTTIPYDPTLTLGNICPNEKLEVLKAISALQRPLDAKQEELNSAILLRRSLDMTRQELVNLNVPPDDLDESIESVGTMILDAAKEYASTAVQNLPKIAEQRAKLPQIDVSIESPIDYNRSQISKIPLAADSLTMDAQYFSFDETTQDANTTMATLKAFVTHSTRMLGTTRSAEVSAAATTAVNMQREQHDIQGTLVITANCTHKAANIFAPFVIDVDKAIRAWNAIFTEQSKKIKVDDVATIQRIASEADTTDEATFNLLSGATYGSSFVGMVHILKESSTSASQTMYSVAGHLQASMEVGAWFSSSKGGFGVDSSFAHDAKKLLSSQNISSHVSLVTMGVIPTIQANNVQLAVKQFTELSPDKLGAQLAALHNANAAEQDSVKASAEAARTGQALVSMDASRVQSTLAAVGEIDDGQNQMLDINSLMTAFTDYVNKAIGGDVGVPINYFLKPITRSQLAQMWVAKYLPGRFITSAGDDTGASNTAPSNPAPAAAQ